MSIAMHKQLCIIWLLNLPGYPIEADDLARILLIAAPGPVLIVFVAASRVQLLPLYVDHAKSCPATVGSLGCGTLQIRCVFWCLIWGKILIVWFDKGWATWEELCFCHRISKSMRSAWRWQMPVYLYWSPAANDDNPFRNRWRNLGTWELLDTLFFWRGKFAQSSLKHNQHSGQSFQNWRSTRCWHLLRNGPLMFFSLTWSLALLFDTANLQRWSA